jgi:histidine triad (HIT) family protein
MDCVFCSIVAGEAPAWRIYENETTLAFLDIGQATPGHTLVVPKRHAPDIWGLFEDEAVEVMRSVHRVAAMLLARLQPEGLNVVQSNGAAAWQDVLHYHVHLVPRYPNDGLTPLWHPTTPTQEELGLIHRRIMLGI